MDFAFNDEQREIQSTAEEFLSGRFMPAKVRRLAGTRSYGVAHSRRASGVCVACSDPSSLR
mgnify:CR=1 FL=1